MVPLDKRRVEGGGVNSCTSLKMFRGVPLGEREKRQRGIEGESIRKRRRTSKLLCAPAAGERGEGRRTEETYVKKKEGVNW